MNEELKANLKNLYYENKQKILGITSIAAIALVSYKTGIWRGRAEGIRIGNKYLIQMAEQISKVESK